MKSNTRQLALLQSQCKVDATKLQQVLQLHSQLQILLPSTHQYYLQQLYTYNTALQQDLLKVAQYFQNASSLVKSSEQTLSHLASNITPSTQHIKSTTKLSLKQTPTMYREDMFAFTHRFHTTFQKNRNIIGYIKNGACIGYFAGIDMYRGQIKKRMKYATFGGDLRVGSADVSVDASAKLFKNFKFRPSLQFEGDINATIAQMGVHALLGNDYLNVQGEAVVKVGTAHAQAKAVISKEEITMKASVGAAAVRGEVRGAIQLFGLKISATGIGELGSVGASAEFSSKKGEFEFGTKASFLAGLGFKIRVTY